VNVLSLALALSGVALCWLPGWGWLGVAAGLGACALAFRGFAQPATPPGDIGYDTSGFALGGWSVIWGTAMQIKHTGGALDVLLLPLGLDQLEPAFWSAFGLFWVAIFASRMVARVVLVPLAALAFVVAIALGVSGLITYDDYLGLSGHPGEVVRK
jgi:hypothetical protein